MIIGIVAGIVTGALWGLTFVASRAVAPFSAWDITVARYAIFGLMSVLLMVMPQFRPRGVSGRLLGLGLALGGFCYNGYFLAIAFAVDGAGAAIPPLIVGTMPVILAILGNVRERAVPWRALALPLGLIAMGVLIVNGSALGDASPYRGGNILAGTAWAIAALAIWVVYGALNAAVMRGAAAPTPMRWTCVQGVGALVGSLALLPMTGLFSIDAARHVMSTTEGWSFLAWAVVMGIGGSWFAAWAWIVASQRLPLAFAAQLVVFETVFGLIAGFVYEHRWPSAAEAVGSLLQLAGVVVSVHIFTRPPPRAAAVAGAAAAVPSR